MKKIKTVYKELYMQSTYHQNYKLLLKGLGKKMKQLTIDWEKILVNHVFNKGFISKLQKELSKINIKNIIQ